MSSALSHSAAISQIRLWQLISPTLPVGAFAYSQGLEFSVEAGWVNDESTTQDWIAGLLSHNLGSLDLPLFSRLYTAWKTNDDTSVYYWNNVLQASRESSELLAEDCHLGLALLRLLPEINVNLTLQWPDDSSPSFITLFSLASMQWNISLEDAAQGFAWAWCENQVIAAIKLVPLGQSAGQRILTTLAERIPSVIECSLNVADEDIGALAPGFAIASALHETQYTRLFRS